MIILLNVFRFEQTQNYNNEVEQNRLIYSSKIGVIRRTRKGQNLDK